MNKVAVKNGAERIRASNTPLVDDKKRILLPSAELDLFLKKNHIAAENFPNTLALILNDTADGLWGMTEAMFGKLTRNIREKNRGLINFLYKSLCLISVEQNSRRTSALTQLQDLGIINFSEGERLQVVCSHHEDFQDSGFFLRFAPVRIMSDEGKKLEYVNLRDKLVHVFGTDFLDFLFKMQG